MTAEHREPVTVIGLGPMGSARARAFVDAGYPTTVWHRLPGRADELVARGAVRAATLVEAVSVSRLVVICVIDYLAMREIVNSLGGTPASRVVVNLTAGTAEEARETAEWVRQPLRRAGQAEVRLTSPHTNLGERKGMDQTTERAGAREWLGLAVLALPTLLLSVDATVLYLALPHLGTDLRPTATETLWIIDIYGFMIAGFLITMGTLGDRVGRRRLLLIGALAFGAASVAAAYATDPTVLIGARALLGVAGATLMPSTLALISTMFHDATQRGVAIGVWAACFSAGVAAGPLIGGALLELFWWGSVFLLAVPVMLLLLVTAPFLLPESRDPAPGRLDLLSVVLSMAAILPVVYGLKAVAADGPGIVGLAAIVLGAVFAVAFVRRQRVLPDPLLDLRLFARPAFVGALLALLVGLAVVGVVYLFATQYLQMVAGYSPLTAGLWLLPSAAAMIVSSMAAPALARKVPAGVLVAAALGVSAVGYLLLALVDGPHGLALVVAGLVVVYLGIGPMMALGTELVVGAAPPERAGSAAAMSETSMEFGLALGVAVLGSVGTAVYRSELPDGAPADAVESLAVGGAEVADAARAAFTSGLNVVGVVSAIATAAIAVTTFLLVRDRPAASEGSVATESTRTIQT